MGTPERRRAVVMGMSSLEVRRCMLIPSEEEKSWGQDSEQFNCQEISAIGVRELEKGNMYERKCEVLW